jgi:hypothetical protein
VDFVLTPRFRILCLLVIVSYVAQYIAIVRNGTVGIS